MGTKTETKVIGEHTYAVTQWNATKAMVMKLKVGKYLGGVLSAIISDNTGEGIASALMGKLGDILDDVNPEEFVQFIKEIACNAGRDNERMKLARFDEYFAENFIEAYQVAFFVLEVNYKDFLASILSLQNVKLS